jgi:hypothetical protein
MEPRRALGVLRQRLTELEAIDGNGQALSDWRERTRATLEHVFPLTHRTRSDFDKLRWISTTPQGDEQAFFSAKQEATAILRSAVYEVEELTPDDPADAAPPTLAVYERHALEPVLQEYEKALDADELAALPPEDQAEAQSEIDTLSAQIRSPHPKRAIVRAALRSLGEILKYGLGGAAGVGLIAAIEKAAAVIR